MNLECADTKVSNKLCKMICCESDFFGNYKHLVISSTAPPIRPVSFL